MALVPLALVVALVVWALTATGSLVQTFAGVSASPARDVHRARGNDRRAGLLPWRSRDRLAPSSAHRHAMGGCGHGIRRGRPGPHGRDEPTRAVTAQRRGQWDDADPAADDNQLGGGGPVHQLRPTVVPELRGQPAGDTRSQYHSRTSFDFGLRLDRERQLRVGHPHTRAGRSRHRGARLGHPRPPRPPRTRDGARVLPRAARVAATLVGGASTPVSEGPGADPVLARGYGADFNETAYPFHPGPRPSLHSGQSESWFFGESLAPSSATVLFAHPAGSGALVRFGLLGADGSTRWGATVPVAKGASRVSERLPHGDAIGLSVQVVGSIPAHQAVIVVDGHSYELAGSLSTAVVPGPWHQAGQSQGYVVYTFTKPPMPVSASTHGGRPLHVTVISSTTKSEEISVDAPTPSAVIRSVAWDSGWQASVSTNGGPARTVPVHSFHLVQQVRIPAGRNVVTFRYQPPHLVIASILSVGAIAVLLGLLVGWLVVRRRRHPPDSDAVAGVRPKAGSGRDLSSRSSTRARSASARVSSRGGPASEGIRPHRHPTSLRSRIRPRRARLRPVRG